MVEFEMFEKEFSIIHISASNPYDVVMGRDLLRNTGDILQGMYPTDLHSHQYDEFAKTIKKKLCDVKKICVITDEIVMSLYGDILLTSLTSAGYDAHSFCMSAGESGKSITAFSDILEYLAEKGFTRSDAIIAFGGGTVGDTAGFAAATYMRGISFIQFPTTLLSAVDSSIGGKTSVNLQCGKNLAGAFHQPELVVFDETLIKTLPEAEMKNGLSEIIKAAIISDKEFFDYLAKTHIDDLSVLAVVASAVNIKREIVEKDERDNGVRQVLNFGHTAGHAIERCSDYMVHHGAAVAEGMCIMSRAGTVMGITDPVCCRKIVNILKFHGITTMCDNAIKYTASGLASAAAFDKKRKGEKTALIFPVNIGEMKIIYVDEDEVESIFKLGLRCRL